MYLLIIFDLLDVSQHPNIIKVTNMAPDLVALHRGFKF